MKITLRTLDNIGMVLDETVDIGVGEMEIPGCSNDTARSLIELVREMLGTIKAILLYHGWKLDDKSCPGEYPCDAFEEQEMCPMCHARSLIERMEEES